MNKENDIFLTSYFALLAGWVHYEITGLWPYLSPLPWYPISLCMIFFFSSHFFAALFPRYAWARILSFLSLLSVLGAQTLLFFPRPGMFLFLFLDFLVCFFPEKIIALSQKMTPSPSFSLILSTMLVLLFILPIPWMFFVLSLYLTNSYYRKNSI